MVFCFLTSFPTSELPGQVQGVILLTRYEAKQGRQEFLSKTAPPYFSFYLTHFPSNVKRNLLKCMQIMQGPNLKGTTAMFFLLLNIV